MKVFRIRRSLLFVALSVLSAAALLQVRPGRGQSQSPTKSPSNDSESKVKPTVLLPDKPGSGAREEISNVGLNSSAASNAVLRNELTWTFGSKQQRGWFLYLPLIDRLLNTNEEPAAKGFATALARWQEMNGLKPNGLLDEESFMAMISVWQSRRLKNREVAAPDQLVIAPGKDFFDPERLEELRQVERTTYAAYKRMVAAAIAEPSLKLAGDTKYLKIISAFRSREYQEKLRREAPNAGSAGLAVNSPHFTGRALDIYVGGEPVDTRDSNRAIQIQTPVYLWLVRNAERFGFRPYCYEPWHWEYVN